MPRISAKFQTAATSKLRRRAGQAARKTLAVYFLPFAKGYDLDMGSLARNENLERPRDGATWDVVVIGGGATGLGSAVDAASRGYRTLLVEARDFAHGTSSRSTKLIHGGVRYLAQGNIALVREALHERTVLLRNTPHSSRPRDFVVPAYRWLDLPYYGVGLKAYDWLAGKSAWARHTGLPKLT